MMDMKFAMTDHFHALRVLLVEDDLELGEAIARALGTVCLVRPVLLAMALYRGLKCAAVVADIGPRPGEGSIVLAEALGIPSSPKHGGVDSGVTYVRFPRSTGRLAASRRMCRRRLRRSSARRADGGGGVMENRSPQRQNNRSVVLVSPGASFF